MREQSIADENIMGDFIRPVKIVYFQKNELEDDEIWFDCDIRDQKTIEQLKKNLKKNNVKFKDGIIDFFGEEKISHLIVKPEEFSSSKNLEEKAFGIFSYNPGHFKDVIKFVYQPIIPVSDLCKINEKLREENPKEYHEHLEKLSVSSETLLNLFYYNKNISDRTSRALFCGQNKE